MFWWLLGALVFAGILLTVIWWQVAERQQIRLSSASPADDVAGEEPDLPPVALLSETFPAVTAVSCPNCGTPLPAKPAEDGFVRCAYCESTQVTRESPYHSPVPLQREHAVVITDQDNQATIHLDGQVYSHLDDIIDPETRRVAAWALQRHFDKMAAGPSARSLLLADNLVAEEIEKIVHQRLWKDPLLRHKQISLDTASDGMLRIEVDGQTYDSVDQVPGARLQQLFRDSIREWEQSH